MCGVDQASDVEQRHALGVQAGMQVVGDLLRRPTPSEVVTHVVRLGDERLFRLGRPGETDGALLREVRIVLGARGRDAGAARKCKGNHDGDGDSDRPSR